MLSQGAVGWGYQRVLGLIPCASLCPLLVQMLFVKVRVSRFWRYHFLNSILPVRAALLQRASWLLPASDLLPSVGYACLLAGAHLVPAFLATVCAQVAVLGWLSFIKFLLPRFRGGGGRGFGHDVGERSRAPPAV